MFHIDNILLVYKELSIVTQYIKKLDGAYRLLDLLIVIQVKYYEYLGILLDLS